MKKTLKKIMLIFIYGSLAFPQTNNTNNSDYKYETRNTIWGASFSGIHYETYNYKNDNPKTSYNINYKWPIYSSSSMFNNLDDLIPAGKTSRMVLQLTKRIYNSDYDGRFFGYGLQLSLDKFDSEPFSPMFNNIVSEHITEQGLGAEILAEFGWRLSLGNTFTMAPCIGLGYGISTVKDSRESITIVNLNGEEEDISNNDYDQDPGFGGINLHIGLGFGLRQKNN